MQIEQLKSKIQRWQKLGLDRLDRVELIKAHSENGDIEALLGFNNELESKSIKKDEFNLTDVGNAEYFISLYGDALRYDHSHRRWLHWDKHFWKPDTDKGVTRLAVKSVRERYKHAVNIVDLEQREKVAKWAICSEQKARTDALLAYARDFKPIADSGERWDSEPYLFCVDNGVIDLSTGKLRPGKPEDNITMKAPVVFDPAAIAPRWMKFLLQVTNDNEEVMTYLKRAVGYSMTGETKNQCWFFLYGLGSNGKTTFTMTLRRLMGDYGIRLDSDDLMLKDKKSKGSSPKEGVADTRGKRFAVASEVQDGKRLDIGLLKDMTGQDTLKARRLYEHEVEFSPTHKLWMFGNHKPLISDTTNAAWRRLKLIPFSYTVPESELDLDLQTKLEAELPGILNWAIEGFLEYQSKGLLEPNLVTDAVAAYRHDSDILGDFIDDCCVLESIATIPKSELKEIYETWCKDNSIEPITQRTFKNRLEEKGVGEGRNGKVRFWKGIRQKTDDDDDENNDKSDKTSGNFETKVTRGNEKSKSPPMKEKNEILFGISLSPVTVVTNDTTDDLPDYPTQPCQCGCTDYWLREASKFGGLTTWLCASCHPGREVSKR